MMYVGEKNIKVDIIDWHTKKSNLKRKMSLGRQKGKPREGYVGGERIL